MEQITNALTGSIKRVTRNNREVIIAPVTMLVPGVLSGSEGALYYPPEVSFQDYDGWNGMPVIANHSFLNGVPVSARKPEIESTQRIGTVYNAGIADKLTAEAHFDVEDTRRVDRRILAALERGEKIECSTGLFVDASPAPEGSVYNAVPYSKIVRRIKPDHLAVLIDGKGACSVSDGCGVNNDADERRTLWQRLGSLLGFNPAAEVPIVNALSFDQIREQLQKQLSSRYTQDKPSCWIRDVFDDHLIYWQGDDLYRLSYAKTDTEVMLGAEDPVEVVRDVNYVVKPEVESTERETMSMNREATISWLTTNCSCWKDEGDKEVLNKLSDEKLTKLKDAAEKSKALAVNQVATPAPAPTPVAPAATVLTTAEWLATAPPEVRTAVQNSMRIAEDHKQILIARITANVESEEEKKGHYTRLATKSVEDLEYLASLIPTVNHQSNYPHYAGQAPTPNFVLTDNEAADVLDLETARKGYLKTA